MSTRHCNRRDLTIIGCNNIIYVRKYLNLRTENNYDCGQEHGGQR